MSELWSTVGRRALPRPPRLEEAAGSVEGTARVGRGDTQTGALFWFGGGCEVSAQGAEAPNGVELQGFILISIQSVVVELRAAEPVRKGN